MLREAVKAPEIKPLAPSRAFQEPIKDRQSQAAGDDWDSIEPEEFTELVE